MNVICLDSNPFDPVDERTAMVQCRMDKDGGGESKGEHIGHGIRRREVEGRVLVVSIGIECVLLCEYLRNIVHVAKAIEWFVGSDWEVCEVPSVGVIQHGYEDPVKEHETNKDVDLCPPRHHEWASDPTDLCPIEGENGHPQSRTNAEQLVDGYVCWRSPAHEREER